MRKYIAIIFLLLVSLGTFAKQIDFSDDARYSIVTCAPGMEAYSAYGHTALRVVDPLNGLDVVFNYGIFSFQTENFILKFVKGETDYQLGVYPYKNFIQEYINDQRTVWEQRLNLTLEEKNNLEKQILNDYLPENRVYRYNFFFDNCATRVRDRVLTATSDSVVITEVINSPQTFRQLIDHYIKWYGWMKFGINLAVAKPAERVASFEEEMFLPEYLMSNFEVLMIKDANGLRPLVGERVVLNSGIDKKPKQGIPPVVYFSLLLIVLLVGYYFLAESYPRLLILSYVIFFVVGLAGCLLTFLAGFSEHPAMAPNFNLLWALPTHILVFIVWPFKRFKKVVSYYWLACIPYYVLVSFALLLSKQHMDNAVFLINGILFVSAIFISKDLSAKAALARRKI